MKSRQIAPVAVLSLFFALFVLAVVVELYSSPGSSSPVFCQSEEWSYG